MKKFIFAVLILLTVGIKISSSQVKVEESQVNGLEILTSMLQGYFSSEEQSKADTNYYDIRLHMVRIWKDRTDGVWIYAEQASAEKLDKPYRQRVYNIIQVSEKNFESIIYTFENPLQYAGDWKKDNPLADLSPEKLSLRKGCTVFLEMWDEGAFSGSTMGKDCASDLRNAKYATSEVIITQKEFRSWDRGFNEKDEQVWGAEKGPYIFKKQP